MRLGVVVLGVLLPVTLITLDSLVFNGGRSLDAALGELGKTAEPE
jgi:hypothetical protein